MPMKYVSDAHHNAIIKTVILIDHIEDHIKLSWLENDCIDANAPWFGGKISLVVQYGF